MKAYIVTFLAGSAAIVLISAGVGLYGNHKYKEGQAACKEAHRVAGLEQFQHEAEKLFGLADLMHEQAQALAEAKPKVIERYTRVEVQAPLPAGCVLDADRLRVINDGIREANSTGIATPAMPADTPGRN